MALGRFAQTAPRSSLDLVSAGSATACVLRDELGRGSASAGCDRVLRQRQSSLLLRCLHPPPPPRPVAGTGAATGTWPPVLAEFAVRVGSGFSSWSPARVRGCWSTSCVPATSRPSGEAIPPLAAAEAFLIRGDPSALGIYSSASKHCFIGGIYFYFKRLCLISLEGEKGFSSAAARRCLNRGQQWAQIFKRGVLALSWGPGEKEKQQVGTSRVRKRDWCCH